MTTARLFRVILPVADIDEARRFYSVLLESAGAEVSPGRHYFECGGVILALYSPREDGDAGVARPNLEHLYFAVDDLERAHERARRLGALSQDVGDGELPMGQIAIRPWGERSFYARDPTGNPLCFVDAETVFTGRRAT